MNLSLNDIKRGVPVPKPKLTKVDVARAMKEGDCIQGMTEIDSRTFQQCIAHETRHSTKRQQQPDKTWTVWKLETLAEKNKIWRE